MLEERAGGMGLQGRGAGQGCTSSATRHMCAMQTQEEELQSRLYFFKLGGLKETALGHEWGFQWELGFQQTNFVLFFPQMIPKQH